MTETYVRISAAMLSESEQQSFTFTAVKKAIEIVIREGVEEQNALAGLQTFRTKTNKGYFRRNQGLME